MKPANKARGSDTRSSRGSSSRKEPSRLPPDMVELITDVRCPSLLIVKILTSVSDRIVKCSTCVNFLEVRYVSHDIIEHHRS